jgi:hypothetical protein
MSEIRHKITDRERNSYFEAYFPPLPTVNAFDRNVQLTIEGNFTKQLRALSGLFDVQSRVVRGGASVNQLRTTTGRPAAQRHPLNTFIH